ncbi:MAG: response regulator [Phocaeicola sp.]
MLFLFSRLKKQGRLGGAQQSSQQQGDDQGEIKAQRFYLRSAMQAHIARAMQFTLSDLLESLEPLTTNQSLEPSLANTLQKLKNKSLSLKEIYRQLLAIHEQEDYSASLQISSYQAENICDIAIHSFRELLGTSHLQLNYRPSDSQIMIWVDYKKIEFVLCSLLAHSFRSIDYSGLIELSVTSETVDGQEYCCFAILEVGERSTSAHEGGAYFLNEIIDAHQGKIVVRTLSSNRLLYHLYIPLGRAHFENQSNLVFVSPEAIQEIPQEAVKVEKPLVETVKSGDDRIKIVVIEDNEHIRLYLNVLLSKEYAIYLAQNGDEGVKLVNEVMPELILSDVMMPVMNGFECCKVLKENLETCHIPIILLTALTDDKDVIRGLELGADDYLLKPFNPEILQTKIKRLLTTRKELKAFYAKLFVPVSEENPYDVEEAELNHDPFIAKLLDIIALHFRNTEFGVKQLAEIACMSQPTLYRKVKQATGFSVVELIRGVRLKESAILLKSKQCSVQEVAESVGYNDIPTFRKHFVELYGVNPSHFVKQQNT